MQRAEAAFDEIHAQGHKKVGLAHDGVLAAALLGVSAVRNPFMLYNGSISMLDWGGQLKLMTLNQIDRLQIVGGDYHAGAVVQVAAAGRLPLGARRVRIKGELIFRSRLWPRSKLQTPR